MTINEKQTLLKQLIKKIGFSQKKFARRYFWDKFNSDNEVEIKQFEEKFKKQLLRPSTSRELINEYINYLFDLDEAKNLDYIKPKNTTSYDFSIDFNDRMKTISKKINRLVTNRSNKQL